MLRRYWNWRRERLELVLADHEDHRSKWGWSYKPSERAAHDKRTASLERRLTRIQKRLGIAEPVGEEAGER